jgi:lipopolysaccharide transport system permease protein
MATVFETANRSPGSLRYDRIIKGGPEGASAIAYKDFVTGARLWRLWGRLGWNDILQRYRRSILGPLWLTASMSIMVIALGILYSQLFKTEIRDFLPFLCVGLLVWNFLSSFLTEAGALFTGSESYIKQIKLPYSVYVYRTAWSKLIIFAHNFVIYFGVLIYFQIWPGMVALLAIPALIIVTINGALVTLSIGLVSARFRDIPQLVNSLTQIIFFVTPIMWKPELLEHRAYIAEANPFFHLVEIVRSPLLGNVPAQINWLMVLIITVINFSIAAALFIRFRARIAYWV